MALKFPFKQEKSPILGIIRRPLAKVLFWSKIQGNWIGVRMIVDTGADYTLLPRFMAEKLGINLEKDCKDFTTFGVGGGRKSLFPTEN